MKRLRCIEDAPGVTAGRVYEAWPGLAGWYVTNDNGVPGVWYAAQHFEAP